MPSSKRFTGVVEEALDAGEGHDIIELRSISRRRMPRMVAFR